MINDTIERAEIDEKYIQKGLRLLRNLHKSIKKNESVEHYLVKNDSLICRNIYREAICQ